MLKWFLALFARNKVAHLSKQSANAMNVFRKTANDLEAINDSIVSHKEKAQQEIVKHEMKYDALHDQQMANNAMIAKLQNFIS